LGKIVACTTDLSFAIPRVCGGEPFGIEIPFPVIEDLSMKVPMLMA
jgi:hypothetical protein